MSFSKRSFVQAEEEYFSIDDIISTGETLPCRFELSVPNLGFFDSSSETDDLAQGTQLELPLWMAQALHSKHIVSVQMSKSYREASREILNADANVVDLHKLGPYFYHFGLYLLRFPFPDVEALSRSLLQTFKNRFRRLMDSSHNCVDEDISRLTSKLDKTELAFFNMGQKSLHDLKCWEKEELHRISAAELVINHRKRKRAVLEAEDS